MTILSCSPSRTHTPRPAEGEFSREQGTISRSVVVELNHLSQQRWLAASGVVLTTTIGDQAIPSNIEGRDGVIDRVGISDIESHHTPHTI